MKFNTAKHRGRPIYINTGAGVVSLVPEVRVLDIGLGRFGLHHVAPYAVYVIDDTGVRRIRLMDKGVLIACLILATGGLFGLLLPLLLGGSKDKGRLANNG